LSGAEKYGDPLDSTKPWSLKFDHLNFTKFKFATGDRSQWIVVNKDDLLGHYYGPDIVDIQSSSEAPNGT
jgi:hypothetical protein